MPPPRRAGGGVQAAAALRQVADGQAVGKVVIDVA
jgi:hypothetical protein